MPVIALVATADGGYAVEVLRDGAITRVAVTVGLVADTRAEIVSDELAEGDKVVMPS